MLKSLKAVLVFALGNEAYTDCPVRKIAVPSWLKGNLAVVEMKVKSLCT
jgi:hypothetical protein